MTIHYNRSSERENRRRLRQNQTPAEELVWKFLRNRQMKNYKFRRQYSVDRYVIDFYYPKHKAAVEIDGDVHEIPGHKEKDENRQGYLESFGIRFIRIKNEELFESQKKAFKRIEEFMAGL